MRRMLLLTGICWVIFNGVSAQAADKKNKEDLTATSWTGKIIRDGVNFDLSISKKTSYLLKVADNAPDTMKKQLDPANADLEKFTWNIMGKIQTIDGKSVVVADSLTKGEPITSKPAKKKKE